MLDEHEHQKWWRRLLEPLVADLKPAPMPPGDVLRILGVRSEIHPYDIAPPMVYPDRRSALLFARANREAWGLDQIGPVEVEGVGLLGAVDMRRAYREMVARWEREEGRDSTVQYPTDPSLPDDWKPYPT